MKNLILSITTALLAFAFVNVVINCIFKSGLREYYCLKPADVLVIGHSMSEMGIDRDILEEKSGLTVAKYCMNGAGTADRFVMVKHYIEATCHKPKYVLYDVSGRSFSGGLANNSYALFYPFMNDSRAVSDYVQKNASFGEYWKKRLLPLTRYDDTRLGAVVRGYRHDWKNLTLKRFDVDAFKQQLDSGNFWKIGFDKDNMRCFDETLAFLNDNGMHCILLALPCVNLLNEAEPEKNARALDFIKAEVEKYQDVEFHDLNPEYSGCHDLFADPIHLAPAGQKKVTSAVAEILKKL